MDRKYYDAIEGNPVVAAVKDMEGLRICCRLEDIKVVCILFGDICSIGEIVSQVKDGTDGHGSCGSDRGFKFEGSGG